MFTRGATWSIVSIVLFIYLSALTGCSVIERIDGVNKVKSVSPNYITLEVKSAGYIAGHIEWSRQMANSHCSLYSKTTSLNVYIDNSWFKELTYFCVTPDESLKLIAMVDKVGWSQTTEYLKKMNGLSSQIERLGGLTSNSPAQSAPYPASAPGTSKSQQTGMICLRKDESVSGQYRTCSYTCGSQVVTSTVNASQTCEMSKRF